MKFFRNFADIILSSAILALYEFDITMSQESIVNWVVVNKTQGQFSDLLYLDIIRLVRIHNFAYKLQNFIGPISIIFDEIIQKKYSLYHYLKIA